MSRAPFFNVDGEWYVDLTWNFDEAPTIPSPDQWARLVDATPPENLVVARALTTAEVREFITTRSDIDAESFAFLIPKDEVRWEGPP